MAPRSRSSARSSARSVAEDVVAAEEAAEELDQQLRQTFTNYLRDTLGISNTIAVALRQQGLVVFGDLNDLTKADMDQICKNCRKPGGGGDGVQLLLITYYLLLIAFLSLVKYR